MKSNRKRSPTLDILDILSGRNEKYAAYELEKKTIAESGLSSPEYECKIKALAAKLDL